MWDNSHDEWRSAWQGGWWAAPRAHEEPDPAEWSADGWEGQGLRSSGSWQWAGGWGSREWGGGVWDGGGRGWSLGGRGAEAEAATAAEAEREFSGAIRGPAPGLGPPDLHAHIEAHQRTGQWVPGMAAAPAAAAAAAAPGGDEYDVQYFLNQLQGYSRHVQATQPGVEVVATPAGRPTSALRVAAQGVF